MNYLARLDSLIYQQSSIPKKATVPGWIYDPKAARVIVRFAFVDDMAVLEIEDNGKDLKVILDLASRTAEGHYCLAGMKERAEAVNGQLQLLYTEAQETTVVVKIPVK